MVEWQTEVPAATTMQPNDLIHFDDVSLARNSAVGLVSDIVAMTTLETAYVADPVIELATATPVVLDGSSQVAGNSVLDIKNTSGIVKYRATNDGVVESQASVAAAIVYTSSGQQENVSFFADYGIINITINAGVGGSVLLGANNIVSGHRLLLRITNNSNHQINFKDNSTPIWYQSKAGADTIKEGTDQVSYVELLCHNSGDGGIVVIIHRDTT